jgi:hypothetical protein
MTAQAAQKRLSTLEAERESGEEQIVGAIEALASRVASLAERLERERA